MKMRVVVLVLFIFLLMLPAISSVAPSDCWTADVALAVEVDGDCDEMSPWDWLVLIWTTYLDDWPC